MLTRKARVLLNLSVCYAHLIKLIRAKHPKVKLVAIAKDEAAYLVDWVFHHTFFGFKNITVYVNNTSDNTSEIVEALQRFKMVEFKDGDKYFQDDTDSPQINIYREELIRARWQGFSHVCFLDIDEFYTPLDFTTNIHAFIKSVNADVCCLQWFHKMDEGELFGLPFSKRISGRRAPQVKSIVATHVVPQKMTPHNVYCTKASYCLADGTNMTLSEESFSKINEEEPEYEVKRFFVLHRMLRHQKEYIAALKRGRPIGAKRERSTFKDNRNGIFDDHDNIVIDFPQDKLDFYLMKRTQFCEHYQLSGLIEKGQALVMKRYHEVLEMIANAPKEENLTLNKILKNIALQDVKLAVEKFKSRNKLNGEK